MNDYIHKSEAQEISKIERVTVQNITEYYMLKNQHV